MALPARLRTFLARYPPAAILPAGANPETFKTAYQEETPNPFLPTKHPVTGRWHDPKYSLRRQAELVKLARQHHVEELLPFTPKGTEERLRKRVELGLRVKGTGVGQKVKGHKHERQLASKYVCLLLVVMMMMVMMVVVCLVWRLLLGWRGGGALGWCVVCDADFELAPGWRRGDKPCWRCQHSSRNSGRFVAPPT